MLKHVFITLLLCLPFSFNFSQNINWAKQIGGPQKDYFSSLTRDGSGNIILTGVFIDSCDLDPGPGVTMLMGNTPTNQFLQDAFLAKYDPNGNLLWGFMIGGTDGDAIWTVKTDANDDIYVAATYSGTIDFDPGPGTTSLTAPSSGAEIYVAKYTSNGSFAWVRDLRGHQHGDNRARDIALDGMGNLYLVGDFQGSIDLDVGAGQNIIQSSSQGGNSDFALVKMDTSGNYIWGFTVGGPCLSEALAVDGNGDVYVTGSIYGSADFDPGAGTDMETAMSPRDMFVAGYSSNGTYKWAGTFSSAGNNWGLDVVCDSNNDLIFTGIYSETVDIDPGPGTMSLSSSFGGRDGLMVKLTSAGTPVWGHTIGAGSSDYIQAVAVDPLNNIYLVPQVGGQWDLDLGPGTMTYTGSSGVYPVVKYDPSANYISHFDLLTVQGNGSVSEVWADANGNTTVTGSFSGSANFDPNGNPFYDRTSFGDDDIFLTAYSVMPVGIEEELSPTPLSVFPNPFNDQLAFTFDQTQSGSWKLVDLSGRTVSAGAFQATSTVELERNQLPSGVYLLQVSLLNGERHLGKVIAR